MVDFAVDSNRLEADILGFLRPLGWKIAETLGDTALTSPDFEYQVTIGQDGWQLGKFTDSDLDGVAVGRYISVDDAEGTTLAELKQTLTDLKVL